MRWNRWHSGQRKHESYANWFLIDPSIARILATNDERWGDETVSGACWDAGFGENIISS